MRWVARVALSVLVGTAIVLRADHTIASVPVVSSAGFPLLVPGTALDGLSFPARTVQCLSPRFWLQSLPPSSFSAGLAVLALAISSQVKSSQVELYCHSTTCVDI